MVNLLSGEEANINGLESTSKKACEDLLEAAAAHTHVVVDKNSEFIFGVIQSQQPMEEFRQKWSWLLDEYTDQHIWILLFILEERQIRTIVNSWS